MRADVLEGGEQLYGLVRETDERREGSPAADTLHASGIALTNTFTRPE